MYNKKQSSKPLFAEVKLEMRIAIRHQPQKSSDGKIVFPI